MVLPPWRILIVDDDRAVSEGASSFLNEIGAQASWTMDGLTAIDMVKDAQKKLHPYEIILIDWKLPFLNGIQTAKRIRDLMGDEVTILLISAYDWTDVEEDAREAGIQGFISKPLFKSTLYHGLTSCLQLPHESGKPELKNDFSGKRILVAEDNELNWEIIDVLLGNYGLELVNAKDGAECVEIFGQSEPGYYDAILMDVQMPIMDGLEATKAIRMMQRPDKNLPIIAMTADAFSADVKRCLDAGMDAHVAKPIVIPELLQVLTKYLQ